jgi:signal transduction histidine kinase/CheY-like chemotaxis protein
MSTHPPARTPNPVTTFAAIARALTETLDLSEVLRRIANEARALTSATGVSILLRRGDVVEFVAHASPPPGSLIPVGFQFRPSEEVIAAFDDRKDPLVILDLHASPLIPEVVKERIFVRDLIIVPLRVDDRVIGVLNVAFNQLPEEWPWDPALLRALGDQAAVAVRNAQLYEAARRSNEQLVQAEKLSALGRLVARVAHELNNPLTTARLIAESLDIEPLPFPAMEQVRALSRELEHAAAVVRDLLLFVHKGGIEPREVALAELIRAVVADLGRRLDASGVRVELDLEPSLPTIQGDPQALRRVLLNLVENAAQALESIHGDRLIAIRARAEAGDPPWVAVEVEDTGPGIAPAMLDRIFEPFATTKPMGEGTGLGLAIVKEVITAHGGTVEGGNVPMGGARFGFRLPARQRSAATPAGVEGDGDAARAPVSAPRATPRGLRVLVIDDEAELQRALRRVLLYLGCEVTSALTGEEGLAQAKSQAFDLILCDIRIPGTSGRELYERLKLQAPRAAESIVFMTGDSLTDEIRRFLKESGRPSLSKPFGRTQLQDLLRSVRTGRG